MHDPMTDPEKITPDRLTTVLRDQGYLEHGCVTAVSKKDDLHASSTIIPLVISFSDDAPKSAPSRMLIKISRALIPGSAEREVEFYNEIARTMTDAPAIRCYDAGQSATGKFYFLLEDL